MSRVVCVIHLSENDTSPRISIDWKSDAIQLVHLASHPSDTQVSKYGEQAQLQQRCSALNSMIF
jgi:hypothetical protein